MGTEVAHEEASVTTPPPAEPAQRRLYWPRFLVVYGLLALAGAAGIAGLVIGLTRSGVVGGTTWSTWEPSGGGISAARQIAEHVAPSYRLPSGKQLVDVIAKEPSVSPGTQSIPVHYLAVRGTGKNADQIFSVSPSNSVMYSMCGLGSNCSIATGTPSVARGRLVRREILELALYTFKYVGGVKNVIAFMPPQPGKNPEYVVYLTKDELSSELHQPLDETLRAKTPLPNTIPAREVRTVDATTESHTYSFTLSQAQQGDAILVLAPLSA